MHRLTASFVLGYHGCDKKTATRLLDGAPFRPSQNTYDWLGHGVYFWEANPRRGIEWAAQLAKSPKSKVKDPDVIGAVIDLRQCLDLTTSAGIKQVKDAYNNLKEISKVSGDSLPKNSENLMARHLDCAVINFLHAIREEEKLESIDTVRGGVYGGKTNLSKFRVHGENAHSTMRL